MRSINLVVLAILLLAAWKAIDLVRWALSADWRKILREWFD